MISSARRLRPLPRAMVTTQKVHLLSQPSWTLRNARVRSAGRGSVGPDTDPSSGSGPRTPVFLEDLGKAVLVVVSDDEIDPEGFEAGGFEFGQTTRDHDPWPWGCAAEAGG